MSIHHDKTVHAAKGKWRGILLHLGVPSEFLVNRLGPCPFCGGKDRFRFDDKNGEGTFFCNQCGAGKGTEFAMRFTGRPVGEVWAQIDGIVGNVKVDAPRREMTEDDRRNILLEAWHGSKPVQPGDLAHTYLATRRIEELIYPKALRFHPAMRDGEGGVRPCMIAMVGVYGADKYSTMHRTFLKPDGSGKADMASPRKLMPGDLPEGACVALSEFKGGTLGIAEGIETAMSASALYDIPVWASINAGNLAKWIPPEGTEEVAIFGDNDPKFAGQAAAYALARRLAAKNIPVTVHIPDMPGTDWADVYMKGKP